MCSGRPALPKPSVGCGRWKGWFGRVGRADRSVPSSTGSGSQPQKEGFTVKMSKVPRLVAATGIAVGLSAFAAPAALADAYFIDSDGGDVAIQDVGPFNSGYN